jgi:hypothetical protein
VGEEEIRKAYEGVLDRSLCAILSAEAVAAQRAQSDDRAGVEAAYTARALAIYEALAACTVLGIPAGIRIDRLDPDWPVAFLEIPSGQVSWHLKAHPVPWDGHTKEEASRRLHTFLGRRGLGFLEEHGDDG